MPGILVEHLVHGLDPVLGRVAAMPEQHHGVALEVQGLGQPLRGEAGERPVGRGDEADEVVRGHPAIDQHLRDAPAHRARDRGIERLGRRQAHDPEIDLALDQVLDVGRLFRRIVVGIGDDQLVDLIRVARAAAASIACAMPTRQMFETEAFEKPIT